MREDEKESKLRQFPSLKQKENTTVDEKAEKGNPFWYNTDNTTKPQSWLYAPTEDKRQCNHCH